jgi:hypothetical protein
MSNPDRSGIAFSSHLKYAFQFHPDSRTGQIYRGAYQGIGFAI